MVRVIYKSEDTLEDKARFSELAETIRGNLSQARIVSQQKDHISIILKPEFTRHPLRSIRVYREYIVVEELDQHEYAVALARLIEGKYEKEVVVMAEYEESEIKRLERLKGWPFVGLGF